MPQADHQGGRVDMYSETAGELLEVAVASSAAAASSGDAIVVVAGGGDGGGAVVALRTHFQMDPEHCTPHKLRKIRTNGKSRINCVLLLHQHQHKTLANTHTPTHNSVLLLCATFHGCQAKMYHFAVLRN